MIRPILTSQTSPALPVRLQAAGPRSVVYFGDTSTVNVVVSPVGMFNRRKPPYSVSIHSGTGCIRFSTFDPVTKQSRPLGTLGSDYLIKNPLGELVGRVKGNTILAKKWWEISGLAAAGHIDNQTGDVVQYGFWWDHLVGNIQPKAVPATYKAAVALLCGIA